MMEKLAFQGWESCEVVGHVAVQQWLSGGTEAEPPLGCPVTCSRCGVVLEGGEINEVIPNVTPATPKEA